jgi:hypothetical protein
VLPDTDDESEGVVSKQMLVTSWSQDELDLLRAQHIHGQTNVCEFVKPPTPARHRRAPPRFKDERKIFVGRGKKTGGAFMNCFVMQIRVRVSSTVLREFHAKVFNTGKIEIPGVQSDPILARVTAALQAVFASAGLNSALMPRVDMVLINSTFKCGFLINRTKCFLLLRTKYNIDATYDPCAYPGIKCHFYHNPDIPCFAEQTGRDWDAQHAQQISFMIFRTGSVLIVGKCEENILRDLYLYVVRILQTEYLRIRSRPPPSSSKLQKKK